MKSEIVDPTECKCGGTYKVHYIEQDMVFDGLQIYWKLIKATICDKCSDNKVIKDNGTIPLEDWPRWKHNTLYKIPFHLGLEPQDEYERRTGKKFFGEKENLRHWFIENRTYSREHLNKTREERSEELWPS